MNDPFKPHIWHNRVWFCSTTPRAYLPFRHSLWWYIGAYYGTGMTPQDAFTAFLAVSSPLAYKGAYAILD